MNNLTVKIINDCRGIQVNAFRNLRWLQSKNLLNFCTSILPCHSMPFLSRISAPSVTVNPEGLIHTPPTLGGGLDTRMQAPAQAAFILELPLIHELMEWMEFRE